MTNAFAPRTPVPTIAPARGGRRAPQQPRQGALSGALKSGVEALSGVSMDGVNVHFNSPQPRAYKAKASASGSDIHLGPGQEQSLPHEAWHIAQQRAGRVSATSRVGMRSLNDSPALEAEADTMGSRALATGLAPASDLMSAQTSASPVMQLCLFEEEEEPETFTSGKPASRKRRQSDRDDEKDERESRVWDARAFVSDNPDTRSRMMRRAKRSRKMSGPEMTAKLVLEDVERDAIGTDILSALVGTLFKYRGNQFLITGGKYVGDTPYLALRGPAKEIVYLAARGVINLLEGRIDFFAHSELSASLNDYWREAAEEVERKIIDLTYLVEDTDELAGHLWTLQREYDLTAIEFRDFGTPDARVWFRFNPDFEVKLSKGKPIAMRTQGMGGIFWPKSGGKKGPEIKTRAEADTQDLKLGAKTYKVGHIMTANPLASDHVAGADSTGDTDHDGLMAKLPGKNTYQNNPKPAGASVSTLKYIKGHLLNAKLGGPAMASNLYPITAHCNSLHLSQAESYIKNGVEKGYVYKYEVEMQTGAIKKWNIKHGGTTRKLYTVDSKLKFQFARLDASFNVLPKTEHKGTLDSTYKSKTPKVFPKRAKEFPEFTQGRASKPKTSGYGPRAIGKAINRKPKGGSKSRTKSGTKFGKFTFPSPTY